MDDLTKFTLTQARKLDKRDNPKRPYNTLRGVIVREATETEMDKFITVAAQPKPRAKGRTRRQYSYWSNSCTWKLKNGQPVMFSDRLINPPILDISSITKRSK